MPLIKIFEVTGGVNIRTPVLFNFQGSDGATTTTNEGTATLSGLTFNGTAQISNEQAWSGTTSLKIDETDGNNITFTLDDDELKSSEDWTVECLCYFATAKATYSLLARHATSAATVTSTKHLNWLVDGNRWLNFHKISLAELSGAPSGTVGAWRHFAVQHRAGAGSVDYFHNGSRTNEVAPTGDLVGGSGLNRGVYCYLGGSNSSSWIGPAYMGAFRMVAGKALYGDVATYTIPTGPLEQVTS